MQFIINYIVGFGSVFHWKLSSFVSVWLKDKIRGFIFESECLRTQICFDTAKILFGIFFSGLHLLQDENFKFKVNVRCYSGSPAKDIASCTLHGCLEYCSTRIYTMPTKVSTCIPQDR